MTQPSAPITVSSPEEFVTLAAAVMDHPSLEEVEAMLKFLASEDRDFGIRGIEDSLLDIRALLIRERELEQALDTDEPAAA